MVVSFRLEVWSLNMWLHCLDRQYLGLRWMCGSRYDVNMGRNVPPEDKEKLNNSLSERVTVSRCFRKYLVLCGTRRSHGRRGGLRNASATAAYPAMNESLV